MASAPLVVQPLPGLPEIRRGDDLATLILAALRRADLALQAGDVLVVAQKIVSKAEGRSVDLRTITPSSKAVELAARVQKDARFVEVVLSESAEVVRAAPGVLVTRHRLGFVMANAGIDRSNVPAEDATRPEDTVLLLPVDCDGSAARLRARITALAPLGAAEPAVVISDSFGRPWRQGVVNIALGVAGLPALRDLRGGLDREGRSLQMTQVAVADALAAVAGLAMGEAAEGMPVVHVRGLDISGPLSDGQSLIRPPNEDLFR
jgi:coenzyme F420-0:L-glutamate ligase/coenzyme F420-1:gamma-L-glutamate ligase